MGGNKMESLFLNHVSKAVALYLKAYFDNNAEEMNAIEVTLQSPKIAESLAGTAEEFHNASVELVRSNLYDFAVRLLDLGIRKYPRNADIYADILKYGLKCRRITDLKRYYDGDREYVGLKNIQKKYWTWRSFTFSLDYMQELLQYYDDNDSEYMQLKNDIEQLILQYYEAAKGFRDQSEHEKAYMAESEYLLQIGETERAYEVLQTAVKALPMRCPQCALQLADYYFEKAEYPKTIEYASIATESVNTQDAISVGYAFFILAISLERKAKYIDKVSLDEKTCRPIYKAYHKAYTDLKIEKQRTLCQSVRKKVTQLEIDTNIASGIQFSDNDFDIGNLTSFLEAAQE